MRAWAIGNSAPTTGLVSMFASLSAVSHLRGSIAPSLSALRTMAYLGEEAMLEGEGTVSSLSTQKGEEIRGLPSSERPR